jgi:hypothetical protein
MKWTRRISPTGTLLEHCSDGLFSPVGRRTWATSLTPSRPWSLSDRKNAVRKALGSPSPTSPKPSTSRRLHSSNTDRDDAMVGLGDDRCSDLACNSRCASRTRKSPWRLGLVRGPAILVVQLQRRIWLPDS